jgi:hypothetical protein
MRALPILFLIAGVGAAGCAVDARDVGAHVDDLETSDIAPEAATDPDVDRVALATDLWCAACVADGLRARVSHDVRFQRSGGDDVVFVEIDGTLACAGRATIPELELLTELEGQGGGGEDEGNPDPEPALDDELPPSPETPPDVDGGEDEGNPDPEPASADDLPAPPPARGPPRDFGL